MDLTIAGTAGNLQGWLASPDTSGYGTPGVVVVPGFPTDPGGGGANSYNTFPALADRIAKEARMHALTFAFRGLADSAGHFSLFGWRRDLRSAIDTLRATDGVTGVYILGFGTGGALAIDAAAADGDIDGVISVAAPADFQDWAGRPRELLSHARLCKAVSDPAFPPDFNRWAKELQQVSAVRSAETLAERTAMLVLHGSNDDAVPQLDARAIADAHGLAEIRVIEGARHHLRHDPRAMAIAVGWLDRRGSSSVA
jgi:putative redox protein